MSTRLPTVLLVSFALLAGCAADDPSTTTPTMSGTPTSSPVSGTSAPPTSGDPVGASPTPGTTVEIPPWAAYRFDERVEPRSGGAGEIQSYAYTHTVEDAGEVTILDVVVENLGVSTETVRGQSFDLSSGASGPRPISASVEVAKLRHTLTVKQDDTGERAAGDRAVITVWMPTEGSAGVLGVLWPFVHLDFEDGEATGVWESVPSAPGATAMTLPYTEGDEALGWWGAEHLLTTYALSWWAGLFQEGATIEEGSHNFGGFQYSAKRETLDVPGYTFDGWRVSWSATNGTDTGGYTVAVAPELPLPFEHTFASTSGGDTSRYSYELTALELG